MIFNHKRQKKNRENAKWVASLQNFGRYQLWSQIIMNKKVLLRERKRHTARRVASTPYVVLTGYPPGRVPPLARVPPQPGYPPWPGYPPPLPHGILGNVAKHYGIWVPPPVDRQIYGWMEGQKRVKTLPSCRTTYAGGNHFGWLSVANRMTTQKRMLKSIVLYRT